MKDKDEVKEIKQVKVKKPIKEIKYNVAKDDNMDILIINMKAKYNVDLICNTSDIIKFGNDERIIIFNKI